ncbi:hypothetical protein KC957_00250 [Candidatus Saccharibacteria bacterium]|nr:hypothetical protein [Candidatus Saccharibacteria bacterium]
MCKLIADLVGADKHVVGEMVHRLERAAGLPGVDVRLTGEIYGRTHMKMRELGLDPNDTTGKELYHALMNLANLHDEFIARRLGVVDRTKTDEVAGAVAHTLSRMRVPKHAWIIRGAVIKRMLRANPPKSLMHALHYRSADSMIKREPARLLLTMAQHTETKAWRERWLGQMKKLGPSDFEERDITIHYLDELKWSAALQDAGAVHHANTFYSVDAGYIIMTPLPARPVKGLCLALLLTSLHYIHEIRAYSTYIKFHQLSANFSEKLTDISRQPHGAHGKIAGNDIHWRIVHRYYGTTKRILHPEVFEPHVQPEDLWYRKAEDVLYRIEPALHFWKGLDYIGLPRTDGPISFNLMDVLLNMTNGISYESRLTYHLRDSLWNEMLIRYVGQRPLERQLLAHLEEQTIDTMTFNEMEFSL